MGAHYCHEKRNTEEELVCIEVLLTNAVIVVVVFSLPPPFLHFFGGSSICFHCDFFPPPPEFSPMYLKWIWAAITFSVGKWPWPRRWGGHLDEQWHRGCTNVHQKHHILSCTKWLVVQRRQNGQCAVCASVLYIMCVSMTVLYVCLCLWESVCAYMSVCVCVCVCLREREREKEYVTEKVREWASKRQRVCVYMCMSLCASEKKNVFLLLIIYILFPQLGIFPWEIHVHILGGEKGPLRQISI